jgi:hypothetical protein
MKPNAPAARSSCSVAVRLGACLTALAATLSASAKLETWRQDTSSAFTKGRREGVVISDNGRVRLGQALQPLSKLDAARVWDLARTKEGTVFAATGDAGKVFRHDGKDGADWTVAYDADDTQVLSLAVLPDGRVLVGTGPSGQVVDVTDPKHPASRPGPSVRYIWDLAVDAKGQVFAATGPTGQLWKRSTDGDWSLVLDSKHSHLLCVAAGPDGAVYAGSDGEGLIYRVGADGKTSVVFDAPQSEIRTLVFAPDGILYAGTAAEAGGGSSSGRGSFFPSDLGSPGAVLPPGGGPGTSTAAPVQKPSEPPKKESAKSKAPLPSPGSAAPRRVTAGDNAVYRVGTDGVPREIFRIKALIYALAWQGDRLFVGTGPEGLLYEVHDLGQESSQVARLDNGQILALLGDPRQGGLILGTGDPAAVVRLTRGYVAKGTLVSEVRDTKLISRIGALSWRATRLPGTSVTFQVRTGNVSDPDSTWSGWSDGLTDPDSARAAVPPGRFVQYKVTLATRDAAVTPELSSVSLRYQTANLAPEISKVTVPDVSASDGTTRQTRLTLRWEVSDPNDDDLNYTLHIRKEGWPEWVRLAADPLTDANYAWDTTAVPAGYYRVKVTASDRPSNNPDDALTADRVSELFIVDHQPPEVTVTPKSSGAAVTLADGLTRLVKAAYSLDGGEWTPVFPDDGLFDTTRETITIALPDLKPGAHILVVRATDAAGNVGTGDTLIEVR